MNEMWVDIVIGWYMRKSLVSWSMAAMALQTPSVIDIIATRTSPVIWTRNIAFTPAWLIFLRTILGLRFVAAFASLSELKVQKIAFQTIPFPIILWLSLTRVLPSTLSGLRSWSLSLFLLLFALYLYEMHRRL